MRKKLIALLMMFACVFCLAACGCEHEWADANCVEPMTCTLCHKTEGEPLGHVWLPAACEAPKTCEVCAATEGEPKGHSMVEADCEKASYCENCDLTEGEALGHAWLDATTEVPKTCERCALTEGERIITDPRFTTEATKKIQGKWVMEMELSSMMMGAEDLPEGCTVMMIMDLQKDGDTEVSFEVTESFVTTMKQYTVEAIYESLAAEGYDEEAADAAFAETYGTTVQAYVEESLTVESLNEVYAELFNVFDLDGVYYVKNGLIYTGSDWDETMQPSKFKLDGDKLYIDELADMYGDQGVLTRYSEE